MLVTQAVMALLQQVPESVTAWASRCLVLGCLPALWPSSSSSLATGPWKHVGLDAHVGSGAPTPGDA